MCFFPSSSPQDSKVWRFLNRSTGHKVRHKDFSLSVCWTAASIKEMLPVHPERPAQKWHKSHNSLTRSYGRIATTLGDGERPKGIHHLHLKSVAPLLGDLVNLWNFFKDLFFFFFLKEHKTPQTHTHWWHPYLWQSFREMKV